MQLRFVDGHDFVARAIAAGEYGFWCIHVDAVMPDDTLLGAHLDGGVLARPSGYDAGQRTRELIVSLPSTAEQDDAFHAFLRAQIGKPYDLTAIAALVLGRDWTEADSWFCSELQAAALVHAGWFPAAPATAFAKITPRDLLLMVSARYPVTEKS